MEKPVAAARQRLHIPRLLGGIAKGFSNFVDGGVQALVEVHEGVGGPQLLTKFLAGDDSAGVFEQQREHLEGLILQANLQPILSQLAGREVRLKNSELHRVSGSWSFLHGGFFAAKFIIKKGIPGMLTSPNEGHRGKFMRRSKAWKRESGRRLSRRESVLTSDSKGVRSRYAVSKNPS